MSALLWLLPSMFTGYLDKGRQLKGKQNLTNLKLFCSNSKVWLFKYLTTEKQPNGERLTDQPILYLLCE